MAVSKIFASLVIVMLFPYGGRAAESSALSTLCLEDLKKFPGPFTEKFVAEACRQVRQEEGCRSVDGHDIYHFDKQGNGAKPKKILVFSLIHGDEGPAGSVGRYWMERLQTIDPRNTWRVVPVLNPDGVKRKTRTNANHIDLNRNFPTKDWSDQAVVYWKKQTGSNARRFPGKEAGSEPEVQCALKHIESFQPDFIVSVHTPLHVLDFDGPRWKPPKYDYLPWKSLGHFPGSLGRYMWFERQTPVLTMELQAGLPPDYRPFEQLQDVIGTLVKMEKEGEVVTSPIKNTKSISR